MSTPEQETAALVACPTCGRTDPRGGLRPTGHQHVGMCVSASKCLTIKHDGSGPRG